MQISTPTQAPGFSAESSPKIEGAAPQGLFENASLGKRAQKKNGPGIFAKLLEGLITKGKNGTEPGQKVSGTEISFTEQTTETKGKAASEKLGKNNLIRQFDSNDRMSLQKTQKLTKELGVLNYDDVSEAIPAFLKPENFSPQNLEGIANGETAEIELTPVNDQKDRKADDSAADDAGKKTDFDLQLKPEFAAENQTVNPAFAAAVKSSEKEAIENRVNSGAEKNRKPTEALRQAADTIRDTETYQSQHVSKRPESGETEKTSESRGKRGRERPIIEVRDLRTTDVRETTNGLSPDVSKGTTFNALRAVSAETELHVDLDLSISKGNSEASVKTGRESSQSRILEDALARELRGNLSTDIVRDATVIVRNGGQGTIRLSLHPASLGDVKIRLEMAENKITGHIIVESSEALRAFERELPVLEKAFRDSGFSETNLDMSLAQDGANYGQQEQAQEGNYSSFAMFQAASSYETGEVTDWIETSGITEGLASSASSGRRPVNLLV